ncbi:TetR/AcrR family transcriptional regulator [Cryptosporangium aurantiacum]|uniref:Transcriptional regulator, TetR family n=1 Tax=Cryptosporangium aurantiacum TaxID=134849 RepID=A0A1M7QTY9_9ACTN|nr:TetR/AcrR family transcriptional regulator [Cryptosporangium aurantiacum]SHN35113.1 transcriptional regulator, TetR family [Cryptosporangium aurantiacum]
MGNREALLAGAKQCLRDKGYAATTVRDITAAAGGVSMAAIGYHFGSREALLNAAMVESMDELGTAAGLALASSPSDDYEGLWSQLIESFTRDRSLWLASIEAFAQAGRSPELAAQIGAAVQEGRRGVTAALTGTPADGVDEQAVRSVGSVHMALMSGVMIQWLADPSKAPSAAELVAGLRSIAALIENNG